MDGPAQCQQRPSRISACDAGERGAWLFGGASTNGGARSCVGASRRDDRCADDGDARWHGGDDGHDGVSPELTGDDELGARRGRRDDGESSAPDQNAGMAAAPAAHSWAAATTARERAAESMTAAEAPTDRVRLAALAVGRAPSAALRKRNSETPGQTLPKST